METYVIHVTKKCNSDCIYCYEEDKTSTYSWEEIKSFIDKLIEARTSDKFSIEFLGGEPMLEWESIRRSYEYIESQSELDITHYTITTNGTILTEDIADYLSKNPRLVFAISLDGHKWANQLRVFNVSRKNTYDKVLENIEKLKQYQVEPVVHMVIHPYNVAFLSESIEHLYKKGVYSIDPGIVESTMQIDENFAKRYIEELDIVSKKIVDKELEGLYVGVLEWLKPVEDVRSYIIDKETGKTIGESYGRSGKDITNTEDYAVNRFEEKSEIAKLIDYIRKIVFDNHQKRKGEMKNYDN